jgi:hypothetical protein
VWVRQPVIKNAWPRRDRGVVIAVDQVHQETNRSRFPIASGFRTRFPSCGILSGSSGTIWLTDVLTVSLQQSWNFSETAEIVGRCRNTIIVTDLRTSPLKYKARLELFQNARAGILEAIQALAIHWRPTGQFVNPVRFLAAYQEGGSSRFFAGSLNVRFYKISNSPGDMLVDTLRLAALGLPDLQCHFRYLAPPEMATFFPG